MKRTLSLALVLMMVMSIFTVGAMAEEPVVLRMATGYNNAKTGLFFDASVAGEGITLADGITYHTGDLKPTWVRVQEVLNVKFENQYQGWYP